jgi:EAL domain-containing protein (putative c-di-GMP-specific phosphodiesterase class I)/GGDEF domain-containing protein
LCRRVRKPSCDPALHGQVADIRVPSSPVSNPARSAEALAGALPDLVLMLRRDGTVLARVGGNGVPDLQFRAKEGAEVEWTDTSANLLKQLLRRSIANRAPVESRFEEHGSQYEVRVTPQGPDRAVAVVRAVLADSDNDATESSADLPKHGLDRRGFLRRLRDSMSVATLREQPLAVAVLNIDGIPDIAQLIAARVSEQLMNVALLRLSTQLSEAEAVLPGWYLGQLSENALGIAMETSNREAIETLVKLVCKSLREPVAAGDTEFRLTPYAGVSILNPEVATPDTLLELARTAAAEARRATSTSISFHTETLKVRSLARLDLGRELREAIADGDIHFRYAARHELATGKLITHVAYLRWRHQLRGQIRASEFLRVASSTGLAIALSRAALKLLCADFAKHGPMLDPGVRISYGPLRDHLFHDDFTSDIERVLDDGSIPPDRLELRVPERTFVARELSNLRILQKTGIQLVVDEVGRAASALSSLAGAPLWGLQLDYERVRSSDTDNVARKICRAAFSMAQALDLAPIAIGVDTQGQRDALIELGCVYGSGDLYPARIADIP